MNTVFENTVLEAKLTEILNSKLEVRSLMTVDDSLSESAGLTKVVNRYTYKGAVETLAGGEANSQAATISFTPETYKVKRYQQTFRYNDVEAMQDPALIDVALAGAADVMANQLRQEYFTELGRISHRHPIAGDTVGYTDIVEALGNIDREVEDGLFILMGTDGRTAIRKDPDFIAARGGEILYSGQFGTLCGIPVLFSKLVPKNQVIITEKAAVKFFVKKEATLEQSRDIEKKENTIVYERHGVIALTDDTSSVILGKAAPALDATADVMDGYAAIRHNETLTGGKTIRYCLNADAALLGDDVSTWAIFDGSSVEVIGAATLSLALADKDGKVEKSVSLPIEA